VIAALHTGFRKSELANLPWGDVDFRRHVVRVKAEYAKSGEMRDVPMDKTLRDLLTGLKPSVIYPYDSVFVNRSGKGFKDLTKGFVRAARRASIEDFRFHDRRHTFASRLVVTNADLRTVQELLGHTDIRMTQRYAHLSASHKQNVVDLLDRESQQFSQQSQGGKPVMLAN